MSTLTRWLLIVIVLLLVGWAAVWMKFGYSGVSNSDNIEIVQSESSSIGGVALLIRRSDHAALNGDTYFVFLADHPYSIQELRKNLYALGPVFVVGRNGVSIHWANPRELIIQCSDCGITKQIIETQKFSANGIVIRYVGFP